MQNRYCNLNGLHTYTQDALKRYISFMKHLIFVFVISTYNTIRLINFSIFNEIIHFYCKSNDGSYTYPLKTVS